MRMSIHSEKGKNRQDKGPLSRVRGVRKDSRNKNKAILVLHRGGCLRKTCTRCRGGLAAGVRCTPLCHGSCDCGNRRRPSACPLQWPASPPVQTWGPALGLRLQAEPAGLPTRVALAAGGCPNLLESRHMQNRAPLSARILCFQAKGVGEVVRSVGPAWALNGMCARRRGGPSRGGRLVACPPVVEVGGERKTKQGISSNVQHRHHHVRTVESASSSRHAGVQTQIIYDGTEGDHVGCIWSRPGAGRIERVGRRTTLFSQCPPVLR